MGKLFCHIDYKAMVATDVFFYCVLPMDLVSPPSAISMRYYNAIISVNNIKKKFYKTYDKSNKMLFLKVKIKINRSKCDEKNP